MSKNKPYNCEDDYKDIMGKSSELKQGGDSSVCICSIRPARLSAGKIQSATPKG